MSLVERWNDLSAALVEWAAVGMVTSCGVLLVAGLTWLAVRRRASAHLGHLLFLVPLLPLVLPSLGRVELPKWLLPQAAALEVRPVASPLGGAPLEAAASPGEVPLLESAALMSSSSPGDGPLLEPGRTPASWEAWAVLLWGVIAGLALVRFLAAQVRTDRLLRAAPQLAGAEGARARAALERLAPGLGLRRTPRVVTCTQVAAPAVWGVRRPVLVLDRALVSGLDARQLDWVLLHELAHLSRVDLVFSCAQRLVQLLWFFHPLVWFTGRVADELREAACDEAALAASPQAPRRRCAQALVEVAARRMPSSVPKQAALLSLSQDKRLMKKRILRMLDRDRAPARSSSPLGLGLCLLLAGASLLEVSPAQDDPTVTKAEDPAQAPAGATDPAAVRRAVDRSLDWLLAQQASDGHWPTGIATEVETGELNSIGVTGLVMVSFQEALAHGPSRARSRAIEHGRAFLASVQAPNGLFGEAKGFRFMQSHALATLAWLKTRGNRPVEEWRPQAERAVEVILGARNPYRGWRFGLKPIGDNDTFITGLMLRALLEARTAGVEFSDESWQHPMRFIDDLTDPANGRTGYDRQGGPDARLVEKLESHPTEFTELSTAMALNARFGWGQQDRSKEAIRRGAFLLTEAAPRWDEDQGSIDYYYWLFGTEALEPVGGLAYESWCQALVQALVPNQLQDEQGGYWPAIDAWCFEGTQVHATVLCTLALQRTL